MYKYYLSNGYAIYLLYTLNLCITVDFNCSIVIIWHDNLVAKFDCNIKLVVLLFTVISTLFSFLIITIETYLFCTIINHT